MKEYMKPVLLTSDELAEGVYLAKWRRKRLLYDNSIYPSDTADRKR